MRSALSIAFAYFSVVPLQRWLAGIGGLLIVAGLAGRVIGPRFETRAGSEVAVMLGIMLIALVPLMMGGAMMRISSSRKALRLLPHGRPRMLMGATLAITTLAGVAAVIFALVGALPDPSPLRKDPFTMISPLEVFGWSWSVGAILWVITFITSGSRLLSALIGLLPLSLIMLGKILTRRYPDFDPEVARAFIVSAVIWAGFALWYLRTPSIKRSIYGGAAAIAATDTWLSKLRRSDEAEAGETVSPAQAAELLMLGSHSRRSHFLMGMSWVLGAAVFILAFRLIQALSGPGIPLPTNAPMLLLVPSIMMTAAGIAFFLTRRSRMLWLRAGLDRAALFARAERSSLNASVLALGIPAVAFTGLALVSWPDRVYFIGVFAAAQILYCYCVFYGCLSLTRGWAAADILLSVGLVALLAIEVLALQPWSGSQNAARPVVLVALMLLVPMLRWHARRRWLTLDWRVARMTQAMRGV